MIDPEPEPGSDWFRWVADNAGLVFFVLRVQPDLAFEFVNGGIRTRSAGAVFANIHPDSAEQLDAVLRMTPGTSTTVELRWLPPGSDSVYSRGWVHSRRRPDDSVVIEGAMQDVTRLHQVENELRRSEGRHRLLAENAWDVIWTMSRDGTITYVSPAIERVNGLAPGVVVGEPHGEMLAGGSRATVYEYFRQLFAAMRDGSDPPRFDGEVEYFHKNGTVCMGELQIIPNLGPDGTVVEILGVSRDISPRKQLEAELTALAVTDPLTGLWNRRHTAALLSAEIDRAHRAAQPLTLLMLDIDHFKAINDGYGHSTGDHILTELGRRLRARVRAGDVLGRWGGEEFVVLLRDCGRADGDSAAESIRTAVCDAPFVLAEPVHVSVSIGVATLTGDDDLASWLDRADTALYRAKRAGRNAVATDHVPTAVATASAEVGGG